MTPICLCLEGASLKARHTFITTDEAMVANTPQQAPLRSQGPKGLLLEASTLKQRGCFTQVMLTVTFPGPGQKRRTFGSRLSSTISVNVFSPSVTISHIMYSKKRLLFYANGAFLTQ